MNEKKKLWVAIFKSSYCWETVLHTKDLDNDYTLPGYCRLSEWVEVEFNPLPFEEVRNGQINSLQKEREELTEKFRKSLASLDERLSKLLALTGPEDEAKLPPDDDDIPF